MTGRNTGVGVQMKSKCAHFVNQLQCFAQRLNLACVDAMKEIKELEKFRSMFDTLYIKFSCEN